MPGSDVAQKQEERIFIARKPVTADDSRRPDAGGYLPAVQTISSGHTARATASYQFAGKWSRCKIGKLHTVEMQVWTGPRPASETHRDSSAGTTICVGSNTIEALHCGSVKHCHLLLGHAKESSRHGLPLHDQMQWTWHGQHRPGRVREHGRIAQCREFMSDTPLRRR